MCFTFCSSVVYSQIIFLNFKRKNKTIANFYKDSYIAFQSKSRQWQTGYIAKVQYDSFWIRPTVVYYGLMSTDTVHYNMLQFALSDIYAMPKEEHRSTI